MCVSSPCGSLRYTCVTSQKSHANALHRDVALCTVPSLQISLNPIEILRDTRVHAGIAGLAALVAERDDTNLRPSTLDFQHQRPARVTLAGVLAALGVAGAQEGAGDRLMVSPVAVLVPPHRQNCLPLNRALLPTCVASLRHLSYVRQIRVCKKKVREEKIRRLGKDIKPVSGT